MFLANTGALNRFKGRKQRIAMKISVPLFAVLLALGVSLALPLTASAARHKKDAVEEFLKKYDTNHNGVIDKDEFPGTAEEFDKYDKNKDGKLETYEIKEYLEDHHGKQHKAPTSGATN